MSNESKMVAVVEPTLNLPILVDPEMVLEVIRENLDGLGTLRFTKISIPSGGGLSFAVEDPDTGKEIPVSEIKGVIIHKLPNKLWYGKDFDERSEGETGAPDCFSTDMVHGSGSEEYGIPAGQLCAECPKNQWGSSRKAGSRGKDCQDRMLIHIIRDGELFPVWINLPPTCLGNFKDYVKRITNKAIPLAGVATTISLESAKSDSGVKYSKTLFAKGAQLSREEYGRVREYVKTIEASLAQVARAVAVETTDVAYDIVSDEEEAF